MNFAVTLETFGTDIRPGIDAAAGAGFAGVVLPVRAGGIDLSELSISGTRELRGMLASRRLGLAGIQHDLSPAGLSPKADLDREVDRFDRAVRAAAALERVMVLCDLGPLPPAERVPPVRPAIAPQQAGAIIIPTFESKPPEPDAARRQNSRDPAFESAADGALAAFARIADRSGVIIAFRASLADFAALHRTLSAAACPWFGVDLDPVAVLQDELDVDGVFSLLGTQIRHVRGRDGVAGGNRVKPTEIGRGAVDWPGLLANLRGADYRGFLTIDPVDLPDRPAAAIGGLRFLSQ